MTNKEQFLRQIIGIDGGSGAGFLDVAENRPDNILWLMVVDHDQDGYSGVFERLDDPVGGRALVVQENRALVLRQLHAGFIWESDQFPAISPGQYSAHG